MSLVTERNRLSRLNDDVARLRKQEAEQLRKEADATKRANLASNRAGKASSSSMLGSYLREVEREAKKVEDCQSQRAKIAKSIADKASEIARVQTQILRLENSEDTKRQREFDRRIEELEAQLRDQAGSIRVPPLLMDSSGRTHDFFISHASEDKDEFVNQLAERAEAAGLDVWYDQFSLEWGDSLRQKIDLGLASAYFGVVVFSSNFFKKKWTQYELDALVQKDMAGSGRILPIWHRITLDEISAHTPTLAGRLALNTALNSVDEIVAELVKLRDRLKPMN